MRRETKPEVQLTYLDVHRRERHPPVFLCQQGCPITYRHYLVRYAIVREDDRCASDLHRLAVAKGDIWVACGCPVDDQVVGSNGAVSKSDQELQITSGGTHTRRAGKCRQNQILGSRLKGRQVDAVEVIASPITDDQSGPGADFCLNAGNQSEAR